MLNITKDLVKSLTKTIMLMKQFLLLVALTFFISLSGNSQRHYSEMSPEIQKRMDQNKSKGLYLWEGVKVDYEMTIEGVKDQSTANSFKSLLAKECELVTFTYNASTNHVSFTVPAKYDLEKIKPAIKGSSFGFGLFFKESYHL